MLTNHKKKQKQTLKYFFAANGTDSNFSNQKHRIAWYFGIFVTLKMKQRAY